MSDKDELKNLTTNLWWVENGASMGHGEPSGYAVMANSYKHTILYGRKWPVTICKVWDNALANLIVDGVNREIMNRAKALNGTLKIDGREIKGTVKIETSAQVSQPVTSAEWLKDKL